jgi:hypothetical protein
VPALFYGQNEKKENKLPNFLHRPFDCRRDDHIFLVFIKLPDVSSDRQTHRSTRLCPPREVK